MHAARVARPVAATGWTPACQSKGGPWPARPWFASQLGHLPQAKKINPAGRDRIPAWQNSTSVNCYGPRIPASSSRISATCSPKQLAQTGPIGNIARRGNRGESAIPSYVEVLMLLDNSSSMMIGASAQDITNLEALTPVQHAKVLRWDNRSMSNYSWALYAPSQNGQWLWNPLSSTYSIKGCAGIKSERGIFLMAMAI